jgi:pimeloyl-ACP methyl ester carboxylesterase
MIDSAEGTFFDVLGLRTFVVQAGDPSGPPVVLIHGAATERALGLLDCIPGAELHVFDRCAHWVQWDQAERFNRLVADFLPRAAQPAPSRPLSAAR